MNPLQGQNVQQQFAPPQAPAVGANQYNLGTDDEPIAVNRQPYQLRTHFVKSEFSVFRRNFQHALFVPVENPVSTACPNYFQSLHCGAEVLLDANPRGRVLALGEVPGYFPHARMIFQPTHYGHHYNISNPQSVVTHAIHQDNAGYDYCVSLNTVSQYTNEELAFLCFQNNHVDSFQLIYEKVSGHLCGNEIFYVMHDADQHMRVTLGKSTQVVVSAQTWLRDGSLHVSFVNVGGAVVSGMLYAARVAQHGEWHHIRYRFIEGALWPPPVRDPDASTMMADTYYGRMAAVERHFVSGSSMHDIVSFPMYLSNAIFMSFGTQVYAFAIDGTLWYVDKALVYSCADWVAFKPRNAITFAGIQAYARVQARSYRAKPEQTHRIVGMSAALGFVLNVETEIGTLLSIVSKNRKQIDLLNSLIAFNNVQVNSVLPILKTVGYLLLIWLFVAIGWLHADLGEPYKWLYTASVFGRPDVNYASYLLDYAFFTIAYLRLWIALLVGVITLAFLYSLRLRYVWNISTVDHLVSKRLHTLSSWIWSFRYSLPVPRRGDFLPPGAPDDPMNHPVLPIRAFRLGEPAEASSGVRPLPDFHLDVDTHSELRAVDWHPQPNEEGSGIALPRSVDPAVEVVVDDPQVGTEVQAMWRDLLSGQRKAVELAMVRRTARLKFGTWRAPTRSTLSLAEVMRRYDTGFYEKSLEVDESGFDTKDDESESQDFLVPYGVATEMGGPILPHVSTDQLVIAFCERAGVQRPVKDDIFLAFLGRYTQALNDIMFHPTTLCRTAKPLRDADPIPEMSYDDWNAGFSAGKRAVHNVAKRELDAGEGVHYKSVVHQKKEVLLKGRVVTDDQTFRRSRLISAMHRTFDVVESPWSAMKQLRQAELWDDTHFVLFGGLASYVIGPRVYSKMSRIPASSRVFIISKDTKDHDGSLTHEVNTIHCEVEEKLGRSGASLEAVRAVTKYEARDHNGMRIRVNSMVRSGKSDTLSRNCDITASNTVQALRECERAGCDIDWEYSFTVVCGDDELVVVVTTVSDFRDFEAVYVLAHEQGGFHLELEIFEGRENLCRASFCSGYFVRVIHMSVETYILMPMIGRMFCKLGWFVNPNPDNVALAIKGDYISRRAQYNYVPLVARMFDALIQKADRAMPGRAVTRHNFYDLHVDEKFSTLWGVRHTPETDEDLQLIYGHDALATIGAVCKAFADAPWHTIVSPDQLGILIDVDGCGEDEFW